MYRDDDDKRKLSKKVSAHIPQDPSMREALKLHIQEEIGKCQRADGSSLKEVLLVERRIRMDDFPASEPNGNSPWNVDNYLKHEPL